MSIAARLQELGIRLPTVSAPLAAYIPTRRLGNALYVSGQGPIIDGRIVTQGKLGQELTVEQGAEAARLAGINALAAIAHAIGGLEKVRAIVKLNGYVNCVDTFDKQHLVINGASDIIVAVLGDRGRHARAAVGTNSLPMNMPVEIELVAEVE